jgi:iron complex transport system substrate-binding protein
MVPVERVLSLAPNLTEIVYAIGGGVRLAAASQADNFPPEVNDLPRFSTFPLDHERIVELNPCLLLATDEINSPTDADALAEVGIQTYFFSFADIAGIPAAMRLAGELLGVDGEPAALAFEAAVDSVRTVVADRPRPTTLLLIGDDVLYAFGRESFASEAIHAAGGDNLTDAFEGHSAVLSDEFVLEAEPEVIIVLTDEAAYTSEQLLENHPTWDIVPAVRNGRVHGIHPDLLSRPGPRLTLGLAQLASLLHPDLLPDLAPDLAPDMTETE